VNRYQTLNIVLTFAIVISLAFLTAHIIGYRIGHLIPVGKGAVPVAQNTPASEDFSSFAPILEKGFFGKATIGKLTPLVKEAATTGAAADRPRFLQGDVRPGAKDKLQGGAGVPTGRKSL
jgi:general secretion pathway protein C